MMNSKVIRMPEFSNLEIPEKQTQIHVPDEQIFQVLRNQERTLEDQMDGAADGNYVRIRIDGPNGKARTIQVELGKKFYREYQSPLLGSHVGDQIKVLVHGEESVVEVLSVRKVIEAPMTDELIARQKIEGVSDLKGYRAKYIQDHGQELINKLFRALQNRLMEELLKQTEFDLVETEVSVFHQRQCQMLENVSGNLNERLMKGYGEDGKYTLEECMQRFYEDNRFSFTLIVLGKALAMADQAKPSMEEYEQALQYYTLVFEKSAEEVEAQGLQEDVLVSFYLQYTMKKLKEYYASKVTFRYEGLVS